MDVDPALWNTLAMRHALARRDMRAVYTALVEAGVPQRTIAELTGQHDADVWEVITGQRTVTTVSVLERIADGLRIPRGWLGLAYTGQDTYPGVGTSPAEEEVDDMRRRTILAAAAAAVVGRPVLGDALALLAPPPAPPSTPLRVGRADITALRDLTARLRTLARAHGGMYEVIGPVADRAQRFHAAAVHEQELGAALAELDTLAGWLAYDVHQDDHARRHYDRAIRQAMAIGDVSRAVSAVQHAAITDRERGTPDHALKLYQIAQERLERHGGPVSPTRGQWLRVQTAAALALMDRDGEARHHMAVASTGWAPPRDRFELADMDHLRAQIHLELGDLEAAQQCAAVSVRTWQSGDRRDAAMAQVTLAQIHVRAGDGDWQTLARAAIGAVDGLASLRARSRLRPLVLELDLRGAFDLAAQCRRVADGWHAPASD